MLRIAKVAWRGEPSGFPTDTSKTEAIIGFSFSAPDQEGPGLANKRIAEYLARKYDDTTFNPSMPLVLQGEVAAAFAGLDTGVNVDHTEYGAPSSTGGAGLDSYGVLLAARDVFNQNYNNVALVGQARHIGRVAFQYQALFERSPIIPSDLPEVYDPDNRQWWTRNRLLWGARETIGVPVLRAQGKL